MSLRNKSVNFSELINFKDKKQYNPEELWPETKKKSSIIYKPKFIQHKAPPQSKLLQSALKRIRYEQQKFEDDAIEDILSQSSSNFMFSRENTPANLTLPKKKNKHRTIASELFDIQSRKSQAKQDKQNVFDDLILYPHIIGLSELVYAEVMGKERKINRNLMHSWKDCLLPEDNQEVYGPNAPYSFSRVFPINQLERGFNEIYGAGKRRTLRAGQQALLIHQMDKYLEKCQKQITKIARKDYDIISDILRSAKLQELEGMPTCMKQIDLMWKIIATQWKYSGRLDKKNRLLENALFNGKSNFIDLHKQNSVTAFLFAHSNRKDGENI